MDTKRFVNTKFEPRTATIDVPSLADFFPEGDKPEMTVRGLLGTEFAQVKDVDRMEQHRRQMVAALATDLTPETAVGIQQALMTDDNIPQDYAARIEMFLFAVTSITVKRDFAKLFAKMFPADFYKITNKILELTGQGATAVGKPDCSGQSQESETPAPSSA